MLQDPLILGVAHPVPQPKPRLRLSAKSALRMSFFGCVLAPCLLSGLYLAFVAQDQYVSRLAFAVREEEQDTQSASSTSLLGLASTAPRDADLLNLFLRSHGAAALFDRKLGLQDHFSAPKDPVFAFWGDQTDEDFARYWQRQVIVQLDRQSGLVEVEVHAFSPQMAYALAEDIAEESAALVNRLLRESRLQKTSFTLAEVQKAEAARQLAETALTDFRQSTQIADAEAESASRLARVSALQAEAMKAEVDLELIPPTDPRHSLLERRLSALQNRLSAQAASTSQESEALALYTRLQFDLEIARDAYRLARTAHDTALFDAARLGRHLALITPPQLPQSAERPRRLLIFGLVVFFSLLIWCCGALFIAALRERR